MDVGAHLRACRSQCLLQEAVTEASDRSHGAGFRPRRRCCLLLIMHLKPVDQSVVARRTKTASSLTQKHLKLCDCGVSDQGGVYLALSS